MIFKCRDCGTIYTSQHNSSKVDPKSVPLSKCPDCADFDWPVWNKGVAKVRTWLTDPKSNKKSNDGKAKTVR